LNDVLEWIRYPIPNRKDFVNRLSEALVFSKFDMKSGFWQIQIDDRDRYKTAFTTPFGHYEWNVMPFGLKNAPSEFQRIMNDILNSFSHFAIVYIDDVLIYSKSIDEYWKHLNSFIEIIKINGLVVSAKKIKLFQTKIRLKPRFDSLVLIFLKDKFVLLIEPLNLLANSLMLLLIKINSKDYLDR
jgi:hypothetical protein